MAYEIEFSEDAKHLGHFRARDRVVLLSSIEEQLLHQPSTPTRHRKLLQENPLADWELRVGKYRVLCTVDEEHSLVVVIAIGEKQRNVLFIEGKEFRL